MEAIEIEFGDIQPIYARKESCPRNNGYFYCTDCYLEALDMSGDYPCDILRYPFLGCGKHIDGKYCGYTHLGYSWCDNCQKENHLPQFKAHGNFEVVAVIREEPNGS